MIIDWCRDWCFGDFWRNHEKTAFNRSNSSSRPPPRIAPYVGAVVRMRERKATISSEVRKLLLRSVEWSTPTRITFINNTSEPFRTYWLDYEGLRKFYAEVPAGQSYVQSTYVTHPWVATTRADNCLRIKVSRMRQLLRRRRIRCMPIKKCSNSPDTATTFSAASPESDTRGTARPADACRWSARTIAACLL